MTSATRTARLYRMVMPGHLCPYGGSSNVPLGFVSLTENLAMIAMALWMLVRM